MTVASRAAGDRPATIAVVGHSAGAAIAAMVARDDPAIAAVVILAGTARNGARVSVEQVTDLVARVPRMTDELRRAQVEAQRRRRAAPGTGA